MFRDQIQKTFNELRARHPTTFGDVRGFAEAGHAEYQFHLGCMYTTGEGVPQDDAEAVDQIPISAPPSGQALDFGPSETASAWRDLVRQVRPISWALIAVNLCLLGLLIVLFVSWLGTL